MLRRVNAGPTRLPPDGFVSRATPCMYTLRNPRLKSCVQSVAVLASRRRWTVSCFSSMDGSRSMDLRFAAGARYMVGLEKIEIAAFIRLLDVLQVQNAVAAREFRRGRFPCRLALGHFLVADEQIEAAPFDVERDLVAVAHQRKRPADVRFGRHVQHARPVARAAH